MSDFIKKTLLAGVGLASLTREKIEELAKDLAKQAALSEQEGKTLVEDLLHRSDQARKDFETRVDQMVVKALQKLHLPTRESVADLAARVEALERKLSEHQASHPLV